MAESSMGSRELDAIALRERLRGEGEARAREAQIGDFDLHTPARVWVADGARQGDPLSSDRTKTPIFPLRRHVRLSMDLGR